MTIRLHDSVRINDEEQGAYTVKCSPHSVAGNNGISRSRRVMGQINVVEAMIGEDKILMPALVLAMITIKVGDNAFAPFFVVAPMVEVHQNFAYLPYPAYEFDRAPKGGWVYKIIQSKQIRKPICAIPVLKQNSTYEQNPHNDHRTWYYIINKDRFKYGNSRTEEYYTKMLPQTRVFPTSDELLAYQEGMGLTPNLDTELDYRRQSDDENDDDSSEDENGNDYDEDELEYTHNSRNQKQGDDDEAEPTMGSKRGGDELDDDEEINTEGYNSCASED